MEFGEGFPLPSEKGQGSEEAGCLQKAFVLFVDGNGAV